MDIEKEREAFEAWYCRNHTGLKQSDLAKFRTLSGYCFSDPLKINISWEAWQAAKAQAVQEGLRKSQEKVKVYELHVKTLKQIHENEFNEKSESSYILGNLDGFFECLESDLGEIK